MASTGLQTNVFNTQAGNVYLKEAGTFNRYVWGGRRMRVDDIQDAIGSVNTTTRFNARGGVERDSLLKDVPGAVTTSIVMKHEQADRMKSELAANFWHVDKRMHVEGRDRDAPDKWVEIRRLLWGKATQRTDPGTTWEAEAEGLITLPWSALDAYDIYTVSYAEGAGTVAHDLADMSVALVDKAKPSESLLYAVTGKPTAGDPVLLVNAAGGAISSWVETGLTGETVSPVAILGLGDFVCISQGSKVMRSDDRGGTFVDISHSDWSSHNMLKMDAIDQSFILGVGADGYVFASFDGARTWETLNAGDATTENLSRISISRNNPLVAWACGANNALIKTENGGYSWFAVTGPAAATALLGLYVESADALLVLAADGVLYQTEDGGDTWLTQGYMPGVTASSTFTAGNIVSPGADVFYLYLSDATSGDFVFRNVEGGADGYWYQVEQSDVISERLTCIAAVDANQAAVGGGTADTSSLLAVVA